MKQIQIFLLPVLLCALLGCQSFKANRKPQSAGFGGYCPTCLVKNIDKDLAQLQNTLKTVEFDAPKEAPTVRSAVIFDKNGKPVCQVNLLKHPKAVPNFAKLNKTEFVQKKTNNNRQLASIEDPTPPPCNNKYLNHLKKVAHNNMVVNQPKSYKHKTSKKHLLTALASCAVGTLTSTYDSHAAIAPHSNNDNQPSLVGTNIATASGTAGVYSLTQTKVQSFMNQVTKNEPPKLKTTKQMLHDFATRRNEPLLKDKIEAKTKKLLEKLPSKRMMLGLAASVGSFCYLGSEYGTVVYK